MYAKEVCFSSLSYHMAIWHTVRQHMPTESYPSNLQSVFHKHCELNR